ncbi:caspase family protein [Methylovirgula sp. 4M-Z18]|uniref:caspase family protein n=1 Tax=Methylovirgula sp. 4M-Z18 TaxID=2293567 RepID=UPI001314F9DE|nr:caspase family protein [Methylovirgula sp. 4M-Z18]
MTSTAILIGNAVYDKETPLPCCREDVSAMRELLQATDRFDHVLEHVDLTADAMRDVVRAALPPGVDYSEVLFYFSGHGIQRGQELYLCGTTFDANRPNETGFRHSELMDLFRAARPELLVTIFDACFSGAPLVKGEPPLLPVVQDGLRNVLQFSSSLDDQTSLGGDQLSAFTRAFLDASVRKTEGVVYYSDITNALRDEFIGNDEQTPYFVNQGTGREIFVDDASKLASFRQGFANRWRAKPSEGEGNEDHNESRDAIIVTEPRTPKQLLIAAEQRMGDADRAKRLVDDLFDGLIAKFDESEFAELFETTTSEHSTFREPIIRDFIIRTLSRETRPDRFVIAEIKSDKRLGRWALGAVNLLSALNPDSTEHFVLELNCSMSRAELKVTLTPKYSALQQLQLVLSCAPSLKHCYIFEMVTQHPRTDWGAFDQEGRELVRRWHKLEWNAEVSDLIGKIRDALTNAVRNYIEETVKNL